MADDCELITLVGEIDMTRTVELRNVMVAFRESASVHALVDVSDVSFFGSEGVGFLARLAHEAQARAGTVTVINANAGVRRLITISGLDHLIQSSVTAPRAG